MGNDSERNESTSTKIKKKKNKRTQSDYFLLPDRNLGKNSVVVFSHSKPYSLSTFLFSLAILEHCIHLPPMKIAHNAHFNLIFSV